ncbi:UNVERIFIED_CONTAM: hypothetical protein PYX00_006448 [Menopon gallinae]|uniref:Uncharacterized protein n=1 Tax=Menopon gallinae TaxID=328185 RepID=A0AAW2HV72_9NEOP
MILICLCCLFAVKVPQISKIIQNGSAEGINLLGVLLDLFVITSSFAYAFVSKFPFSAWGEVFFLAIQTAIIAILILHYTNRQFQAGVFVVTYAVMVYLLLTEMIPHDLLWSLQVANFPIVICGKVSHSLISLANIRDFNIFGLHFTREGRSSTGT